MKRLILIILLGWMACAVHAQLPESWMGNWSGELRIHDVDSVAMRVDMRIRLEPTDTAGLWDYTLVYVFEGMDGSDMPREDIRAYKIRLLDAEKGHYMTDERNSIELDAYMRGGRLFSSFEVNGTLLHTVMYESEGLMYFTIFGGAVEPVRKSGGETISKEEIPVVHSYETSFYQEAVLMKIF